MKRLIPILILLLTPTIALAQYTTIDDILYTILLVIYKLLPVLLGIAVLVFLWGLIRYIKTNSDSEKKEAVGIITFGVIGLFVIVSIWGLVALLGDTLGIHIPFFGPNAPDEVVIPVIIK